MVKCPKCGQEVSADKYVEHYDSHKKGVASATEIAKDHLRQFVLKRKEWIDLAEYALSRLKRSAHDMEKNQPLEAFIDDLKAIMLHTYEETQR